MKKKLLLTAVAACALVGSSAYAEVNLNVDLGVPAVAAPVYVAPAPVYVRPYPATYDPYHRNHDWQYWHDRRVHDDHAHWDHDHRY